MLNSEISDKEAKSETLEKGKYRLDFVLETSGLNPIVRLTPWAVTSGGREEDEVWEDAFITAICARIIKFYTERSIYGNDVIIHLSYPAKSHRILSSFLARRRRTISSADTIVWVWAIMGYDSPE